MEAATLSPSGAAKGVYGRPGARRGMSDQRCSGGGEMLEDEVRLRMEIRERALDLAIHVRKVESISPGFYGEAGAYIRRCAAGDDVSLDVLTAALAALRATLREAREAGLIPNNAEE